LFAIGFGAGSGQDSTKKAGSSDGRNHLSGCQPASSSKSNGSEPPGDSAKRPPESLHPLESLQLPESKRLRTSQALVPGSCQNEAPLLPERVADAYGVLNLPLTATVVDVQRQSRKLSRKLHPDKAPPEHQARAVRLFRQLQEAKDTVLSWLRERAADGGDESEESAVWDSDADQEEEDYSKPKEVAFGEAGDVMAEFDDDGSGSEGEREDEKAAGVHKTLGDSPDMESDGDESGDEQAEAAIVVRRSALIRTEDSVVLQATKLSHHFSGPSSLRQNSCQECFGKIPRDQKICKKCKNELRQLNRCLNTPR